MIRKINQSKTLTIIYHLNVNVDFMEKKCNSNQRWNKNKCRCECKKDHVCGKGYLWNTSKCICTNGKYLARIMSDSTITCDGIIESLR